MKIIDEVDRIACKIIESGVEITPDFVIMGTNKYRQLLTEHNMSQGESNNFGYQSISLVTCTGHHKVHVKSNVHADHLSIGRITLMDIYIEDILLGEVDIDFGDY